MREAALADFDQAGQLWRWHATVAEYARNHWPFTPDEQRARRIALLPAWERWLKRLPADEMEAHSRLEGSRLNLVAVVEDSIQASPQGAQAFLDALDERLPLPAHTLVLREMVEMVWKTKLLLLPAEKRLERSRLLSNLGAALSSLGRREEALQATKEATESYRKLAEKNPEAFLPNLAMSLNNLGAMFSDLGWREEALQAAKEAADIRRKLAEKNPQAFLPDLARSLGVYGNVLLGLERYGGAADSFSQGLELLAPFFAKHPQAFSSLAGALKQLYLQACQKAGQEPDADLLSRFG